MPIELVTGLPGHGKTLLTIARLRELHTKDGRPVFQAGIKGLKLPWQEWEPKRWQELEPGSVFVIDEAQGHFPVRGRERPPEWIEELAKHRHKGIDFVVITQNPMLIDSFVRRLVDRHFHVVRKFGTHFATVHEFPNGVKENVASSREGSIRHEQKYPKDVFDLYQSAELHTVKRRLPARVFVLLAVPLVLVGACVYGYYRMRPEAAAERVAGAAPAASVPFPYQQQPAQPVQQRMSTGDYLAQFTPRVPDLAYTSPVYDEVTKPVQAPYPAACVEMGKRCDCYTQQGTKLHVGHEVCKGIVRGGFFVAWKAPELQQSVRLEASEVIARPEVRPVDVAPAAIAVDQHQAPARMPVASRVAVARSKP